MAIATALKALDQATPSVELDHILHLPPSTNPQLITQLAHSGVVTKTVREENLFPELWAPLGQATQRIGRPR
jgi:hypothetical protein